jgi:hypothetical protein
MDVCDGAAVPGEGRNGVGEAKAPKGGMFEVVGKLQANMDSNKTRME